VNISTGIRGTIQTSHHYPSNYGFQDIQDLHLLECSDFVPGYLPLFVVSILRAQALPVSLKSTAYGVSFVQGRALLRHSHKCVRLVGSVWLFKTSLVNALRTGTSSGSTTA